MRLELPHILRAYAADLDLAGPQYASMAETLREAADELDKCHKNRPALRLVSTVTSTYVCDDGFVPGVRCVGFGCED